MLGGLPGMSSVMTHYLTRKMEGLDFPSVPEFIEMIADTGAGLYACHASFELFGLEKDDLVPQVSGDHHRRGVLRDGGRRPDHLHLTARVRPTAPSRRCTP
jgi:hypothetical protein